MSRPPVSRAASLLVLLAAGQGRLNAGGCISKDSSLSFTLTEATKETHPSPNKEQPQNQVSIQKTPFSGEYPKSLILTLFLPVILHNELHDVPQF